MELYLLRHGIAEEAKAGSSDSVRQLTDEGRAKTAAVLMRARSAGVAPTLFLSSPYIRAHQTARIAAKELDYKGDIELIDSLVPHGSPEHVWSDLRNHAGEPAVLLAGHEPLMSALTAFFLSSPSLRVEVKKSALIRIDLPSISAAPRGVLRWMLVPGLA
jgi:phosphohistidine phosphatase